MYDVALLIERQLEDLDADQVVALHEGLEDTIRYHLLLPVPELHLDPHLLDECHRRRTDRGDARPGDGREVHDEVVSAGQSELDASVALLTARGQECTSLLTDDDPIETLKQLVASTGSSEVIILTESHIVREFFQIDWTSRAKRALDVPTLHLLEHVPFDAQR